MTTSLTIDEQARLLGMSILMGTTPVFLKVTVAPDGTVTRSLDILVCEGSPIEGRFSGCVQEIPEQQRRWRDCKSGSKQACVGTAHIKYEWTKPTQTVAPPAPAAPEPPAPPAPTNKKGGKKQQQQELEVF